MISCPGPFPYLSDIPMDSLIPSIFCWIIYFMSGLRLEAGEDAALPCHSTSCLQRWGEAQM
jgi:hypothetical protein